MKKVFTTIFLIVMMLTVVGVALVPEPVAAVGWLEGPIEAVVNGILVRIANTFLKITSALVAVSGTFLSVSIYITTHLGDFFDGIPALKDVWIVIRNISSIFIIFFLLFTSISTIIGLSSYSDIQKLIVKVVMVGVLINFSLFFAKVAIDASNIVSLQFYRAITPTSDISTSRTVAGAFTDGGLSNVFMSSLKIPQIYQNTSVLKSPDIFASITIATVGGIIMMITAALSFTAAAIMFTARTAILIFVMALSPLYFAGMIFPQVKDKAKELLDLFTGQLIFMPAYLFLMYVALRLISSPGFTTIFNQSPTGIPGSSEAAFGPTFIGIIIQYVIALIFINAPLIMAIKMGGVGAKWAPDVKGVAGWFGQHTFGRTAKNLQGKIASSGIAARNPNVAVLTNKLLGKASSGTFGGSKGGYDARVKSYVKERTDYGVKGIKISDKDKNAYTQKGMNKWDSDTAGLQVALVAARNLASNPTISERGRKEAQQRVDELENKINDRNSEEGKKKQKEYLEAQALKERKQAYASNLTGGPNIFTSKARKDAADAVRKELKKGKKDKLIDAIKEAGEEDEKPSKDGSEPKDGSGGEKK
ncbi:MAG: hypothetical protein Q7S72_00605 [Candidatus Taylorbacteria bacterium]|nr:hypothetical protein [Candidatus Taylorbacteria bacterium]